MANVLKQPDFHANLPRTGHNLNQEFAFTASTGMILPIYQDFYNSGETAYYSGDLICRTQPLVTAAMADVDLYLDWFFVPISMLFTLFTSKRWMTNDLISSLYVNDDIIDDTLPVFDINRYLSVSQYGYNASPSRIYTCMYSDKNFECLGKSSFRLANHLGFNPYGIFKGVASNPDDADDPIQSPYVQYDNPNVFPMFALAYQAIYQDYFRLPLDDYERRQVAAFNVDKHYNDSSASFGLEHSLFCLRYRPRFMDYFTCLRANPLMSSINALGFTSGIGETPADFLLKVNNYLGESYQEPVDFSGSYSAVPAGGYSDHGPTQVSGIQQGSAPITTSQLRSMFASEKLLRIVGRAKKDYDSQVLAHFGVKVPHDVKHELTHLKSQHSILHIGEVLSTADTYDGGDNGSALGAIGGKGYGVISSPKKPFKFTAPCDGILMCTFSSVPRMRYFGTFDKQNAITDRLSFYQPEYDKLGAQPLYRYEWAGFRSSDSLNSERVGWQYRYFQWKKKFNRVSEAFAVPATRTSTVGVNQTNAWVVASIPFGCVTDSQDVGDISPAYGDGLICKPTDLNGIMVMPYTAGWSSEYYDTPQTMFYTDPFICAFRANVLKVSVMSTYGEPDLNDF